ncbi:MAG: glycosyltransferase family 25 protein [Prevotella sp.]|jgi:glycosyl transferase family 25|nr:glycosyltransferase family 25 protein [Prevotella sp.]
MKIFVIHPDKLKARGEHVDRMMKRLGMDYEFVNEGHSDKQIQAYLDQYMKDGREQLRHPTPRALCTISHFLAYEKIVEEGLEGALVLEDDIALDKDFVSFFEQSLNEYRAYYADNPVLISYEDSSLRFVPRSKRQKGKMLYPAGKGRMAGCYFLNYLAAKAILEPLKVERSDLAIDWYHNEMIDRGIIKCLWCQPTIATQGTFSGAFSSSLSSDMKFIRLRWFFKKNYKKLLYWIR